MEISSQAPLSRFLKGSGQSRSRLYFDSSAFVSRRTPERRRKVLRASEFHTERIINKWRRAIDANASSGSKFLVLSDTRKELSRLTVDVITLFACGYDLNAVEESQTPLSVDAMEFFNSVNLRFFPSLKQYVRQIFDKNWDASFQRARTSVGSVVDDVILKTRHDLNHGVHVSEAHEDLVSPRSKPTLIQEMMMNTGEGLGLTDAELRSTVLMVIGAGFDTSSIVLRYVKVRINVPQLQSNSTAHVNCSWALALLCEYPLYQKLLHDDIVSVCGDLTPAPEHAGQLNLVTAFLRETMRVHGPAPFNATENIVPVNVGGLDFEVGTVFFLGMRMAANRDFPDWLQFRPERWLDISPEGTRAH